MAYHFKTHYTLAQARGLLPQLRAWLDQLAVSRARLQSQEAEITKMMAPGCDVGGMTVNQFITALLDLRQLLIEFERRDIQIKDVDRGLVDFPAVIDGR